MKRLLLIKFGAIGDVLMAIPAVYAMHTTGFVVDWICGEAVSSILLLYPWINVIIVDDRALLTGTPPAKLTAILGLWRRLPRKQYDLCATLYYDRRYKLLVWPVRARRKLMLSTTDRATRLLPGRHHTDEFARILQADEDGERPDALAPVRPPTMPLTPIARIPGRPRVVLAPAGARNMLREDALRRWPVENYVEVARELLAGGLEIVLIGGPDDAWASPFFAGLPITDRIAKLSLAETLGLLDAADVLVTHDTGPLHLAGITSIGIVSVFGPTDPRGRLPRRPNTLALWGGESFACRPCYDGQEYAPCRENGCVRQVTPTMVVFQVRQMLERRDRNGVLSETDVAERIVAV